MSASQIALLGAFAGFTIFFIGLPIGRLRTPMPTLKAGLNAVAIGILVFLLWDVLAHAWEPVDRALAAGRVADVLVMGALLAATFFGIGLLGAGLGGRVARPKGGCSQQRSSLRHRHPRHRDRRRTHAVWH